MTYGGDLYRAKVTVSNVLPTADAAKGTGPVGLLIPSVYSSSTAYKTNEVVTYGGSLYRAKVDPTGGTAPIDSNTWDRLVPGLRFRGDRAIATSYANDEVVVYCGNSHVCLLPHASATFATDLAANRWAKFTSGIRYAGMWAASTAYKKDGVVTDDLSTYIGLSEHTSGATLAADVTTGKIQVLAKGATGDPLPDTTTNGKFLSNDGSVAVWKTLEKAWVTKSANYTAESRDRIYRYVGGIVHDCASRYPCGWRCGPDCGPDQQLRYERPDGRSQRPEHHGAGRGLNSGC